MGGIGGAFGSDASFVAGNATSIPSPNPTIVIFIFAGDGGGAAGAADVAPLGLTENVCPHFGHRIFNPCGGTRRSSTWYGA